MHSINEDKVWIVPSSQGCFITLIHVLQSDSFPRSSFFIRRKKSSCKVKPKRVPEAPRRPGWTRGGPACLVSVPSQCPSVSVAAANTGVSPGPWEDQDGYLDFISHFWTSPPPFLPVPFWSRYPPIVLRPGFSIWSLQLKAWFIESIVAFLKMKSSEQPCLIQRCSETTKWRRQL